MTTFIPRRVFPNLDSLPRSYFLGHHRAGLEKMKTMLSNVDLIIECRDYRVPITSRNPLFEENLAGKDRVIVYTKRDLGKGYAKTAQATENIVRQWHHPTQIIFSDHQNVSSVRLILDVAHQHAVAKKSLMPSHMMVVGMPNVGKSSIINALRNISLHKRKAAVTGDQPGVTRKIASPVKILEPHEHRQAVYLVDTPGVFIPYVPNAESMLKLALCACVKDTIIDPTILTDYLLFKLNLYNPRIYEKYSAPTNDIMEFLHAVARRTGKLGRGGPNIESAALWVIQRWRTGHLGKFVLENVSLANFEAERQTLETNLYASLSQGRRQAQKLGAEETSLKAG